jgi:hypothetical protein
MSATLNLNIEIAGSGSLTDIPATINSVEESGTVGSGSFGGPNDINLILSPGTGNLQANQWYLCRRTCDATSSDNLNLNDATSGIVNGLGQHLELAQVTAIIIALTAPDGTLTLRVGPQGVSDAWKGPFEGVGSTCYLNVTDFAVLAGRFGDGLGTVTDTTANILGISNPGATNITYDIWIIGIEG